MEPSLSKDVVAAQQGDRKALEAVVRQVQDRVHHLAMRMLVNPEDASEATQEILILVVTRLSTYRGESAFTTWVYRVAVNYLLSAKKIRDRDPGLRFEMFRADLETGLSMTASVSPEDKVMLNELRISCTMAMLLCLDLKHRIAYVLGDILELDHAEAAEVLEISKENFRKRLSRARGEVVAFTSKLRAGQQRGQVQLSTQTARSGGHGGECDLIGFAYALKDAPDYDDVVESTRQVEGDLTVLKLQTAMSAFPGPQDLAARIAEIVSPAS